MKKLLHKESDIILKKLIDSNITIGQLKDRYTQPHWCSYLGAMDGKFGCWSLMDLFGLRHNISKGYCKSCDCFTPMHKKGSAKLTKPDQLTEANRKASV